MGFPFPGLSDPPFENTPDPARFVNVASHRQALETIRDAIDRRKGIILVTGAPGVGKSLLVRRLRKRLEPQAAVAVVARPCADLAEFRSAIADGFRLDVRPATEPGSALRRLESFLQNLYQQDVPAVLVVEDAHDLPDDALDLVRRLAAMEADDMPLLQILLVGWPRLAARLGDLGGAALRQRVACHVRLDPLGPRDTAAYVRGRLRLAGAPEEDIFTEAAMASVHRRTGGIPRLINRLCDDLLRAAAAEARRTIDADHVDAIRFEQEFDPQVFEAQLEADDASVLINEHLKHHPLIRQIVERIDAIEKTLAGQAATLGEACDRQAAVDRQVRRYDRIFGRLLPMLKALQDYQTQAQSVLAECRSAAERLEQLLAEPGRVLEEARQAADRLGRTRSEVGALLTEATAVQERLGGRLHEAREALGRLDERQKEIAPVLARTRRLVSVLRRVARTTEQRCARLEALNEAGRSMCERLPARLAEIESALAAPMEAVEQIRAADGLLRKRIEAGRLQTQAAERLIGQAVATAQALRQAVEEARAADEARSAARPPQRDGSAPAADAEAPISSGLADSTSDLTRRVQELRDLVEGLRRHHSPAPVSAS